MHDGPSVSHEIRNELLLLMVLNLMKSCGAVLNSDLPTCYLLFGSTRPSVPSASAFCLAHYTARFYGWFSLIYLSPSLSLSPRLQF